MTFKLYSQTFENGADIPLRFSRDGENQSPSLNWQDLPAGTQSLALIVENPHGAVGPMVHWALYNISPEQDALPEGIVRTPQVSGIGTQAINHFFRSGYDGPCKLDGSGNCYTFNLYALDLPPNLAGDMNASDLLRAMQGHILGQSSWTGQYKQEENKN